MSPLQKFIDEILHTEGSPLLSFAGTIDRDRDFLKSKTEKERINRIRTISYELGHFYVKDEYKKFVDAYNDRYPQYKLLI